MPRYDYGIPNDPSSLTTWASKTIGDLEGSAQWADFQTKENKFRIASKFLVIPGEYGNFVRFQFGLGDQKLIWDLLPGPAHEFGRTFMTSYQSGSMAGIGPEVFIKPEAKKGKGKPGYDVDLFSPKEALANYVTMALDNPGLKAIYPNDAMKRLGLLLYKGSQFELPVTGGQIGYNPYHTETFINQMTSTVSVGLHPEVRDRKKALQSVYNVASSAMVEDPKGMWASMGLYFPGKASQDIIRLHHMQARTLLGERGEFDLSLMGMSTQAKQSVEAASSEFLKRQPYAHMARGKREQAQLMGYTEDKGFHIVEPTQINDPMSQAGYKVLNMILPGEKKPPVAYVRPGMVYTPGSPLSGYGVLYGPEGFPKEAVGTVQESHFEQAIPDVGVQNIPAMELEFGQFKRVESKEGVVTYEKQRELKGSMIKAGTSAIVGLMRYTAPESKERITQEISYSAGARDVFFPEMPSLKLPRQYHIASGEGRSGLASAPGSMMTDRVAAAAEKKFGIEAWASTAEASYLNFPIAFGVAPSLKSFGQKIGLQQIEIPTGLRRGEEAPLVTVGGEKVPASGVTGELKGRIPQMVGLFGAGWHEQQVEMMGEIANIPGATPEMKALSGSLQDYLRRDKMGYYKREPGKPDLGKMGEMYAAYSGTPYSPTTSMEMLFDLVRQGVERPGYEAEAYEKYGHTKLGREWYNLALSGPEGGRAWRRAGLQAAELELYGMAEREGLEKDALSLRTAAGRKRFRKEFGSIDRFARFNRELTGGLREPLGTGPVGYLEYKSRGILSTMVSTLVPEYQSDIPMVGFEERKAIDIALPGLGKQLGTSLALGREGVLESGYGYERPELGGWRQVNQLARSIKQEKSRFSTLRPVGAIDLTEELAQDLKVALASGTPRDVDLNVLEQVITEKYGPGEQILWNPRTKKAMLRPNAILKTATAEFPEATPFFNPLSTLASGYPYAFEEWVGGWKDQSPEAKAIVGEEGLNPPNTSLMSFYRDVTQIFASKSRKVEQQLQSLTLAGTLGGRYGLSLMAGLSGAVITEQQTDFMLHNLANQSELKGGIRGDFMKMAREQLREGPLASLFWRFPMVQSPGGVIPSNLVTTDFLRRRGVHYPEARSVVAGEVTPGSIFATNAPFMAGLQFLPHVGDLDKDPAQLMAAARATRAGLVIPQDPAFIKALAKTGRQTLKDFENILSQSMGSIGLAAGGKMNILAEGMQDVLTKGVAWNDPSIVGKDPFQPAMVPIPREVMWETSEGILKSQEGMGKEYNLRRMYESAAGVLGWSGEMVGQGQSSAGLRYQEYLDKIATKMRTTTEMVYTSIFQPERATGNWQLKAKFGETGGWPILLEAGTQGGQGKWGDMSTYMAAAMDIDYAGMSQEPDAATYPAYALASHEKDVPLLAGMIEKAGTVREGLGAYITDLKGRGEVYDPTQTIMGLSMLSSATRKGEPWGEKRTARLIPEITQTGEAKVPTFESRMAMQQGIRFFGEDVKLAALPATPQMQAMEATFGFLTRQYPVTMTQSALIYGQSYDFLKTGKNIPPAWQGILSRYDSAAEAKVIGDQYAARTLGTSMGVGSAAFWLDPKITKQEMPYYPVREFLKTGTLIRGGSATEEIFRTLRLGRPDMDLLAQQLSQSFGGSRLGSGPKTGGAATGAPGFPEENANLYGSMGKYIVGEDGPETVVFNSPGSIYPANVTRANAIGQKSNMGSWATEMSRRAAGGAATGVSGLTPELIEAAMQRQATSAIDLEFGQAILKPTYEMGVAQGVATGQQEAMQLQIENIRGTPSDAPGVLSKKLGMAMLGAKTLKESPTVGTSRSIRASLAGILGESVNVFPESLLLSENLAENLPQVQALWESRRAEIKGASKSMRAIQAAQYALYSGEAEGMLQSTTDPKAGAARVAELKAFLGKDPIHAQGGIGPAMGEGRIAVQLEELARQHPEWAGGGGRRGTAFGKMAADLPTQTVKDFETNLATATEKLKGFFETIDVEGPESVKGKAALRDIGQTIGGVRRQMLGMQIPILADREAAAWQAYRDDPTPENQAAALQATETGLGAMSQYRTAGAQERGGMRAGTQASRFMRGLIGGWGLMYMGHLAQFPMQQAQFGFAEAEQFQMGMAGYAGGQAGPGVRPFPSVQMQMRQAQLAYGGQGFGALQAMQAGQPPLARDIAGMGLAGAAGGALGLYFSSIASTAMGAESALAVGFGAAAPWMGIAGAAGYAALQAYAWNQQPEQTTVSYATGMNRQMETPYDVGLQALGIDWQRPTLAGMGSAFRYMAMSPDDRARAKQVNQQFANWRGRGGQPSALSWISDEQLPVAAQIFAAEVPEGYDPDIAGQTFLRLRGIATEEQMLESVWAQQRGVDAPSLATALLQAGRQELTQAAAGALEMQVAAEVTDVYEAARLQSGAEIMGRLPISMLEGMYGKNFDEVATGEALEPWARSDLAGLLMQEGQLVTGAEATGVGRDPRKEWANAKILSRIKKGTATSQEIKQLSVSQAREQRAQVMASQAAYYSPNLADAVYADAQRSPKQAELWQTAIASLGQATALDISAEQWTTQITGGAQQAQLGQQALSMTRQYALWGGQDTGQFFGAAAADIESQTAIQRLMRLSDPIAWADAAQEGMPGAAQFAQTVDIDLGGQLTGLGWGTTSLARVGGGPQSAELMAHNIWGDRWQGTGWGEAAVQGIRTPGGRTVGGMRGLQWYQRGLQYEAQQASMGAAFAQIALQEEYLPQFWAVQDQQRALSHEQRLWGFDMQQQQFQMQGQQFMENRGIQRQQMTMQRQWAQQDWAFQDQTRALQWGWKQEDFEEGVRFMTGRQRKLAERGMERETIMFGLEGERIQTQRDRQKETWQLEDQRFEMAKKHFNEQRQLQEENMKKQREFYTEGKKLQDEMIELQREYQLKQLELQKAAIGAQAHYAEKMKEAQDAMQELSEEQERVNGGWKVLQSRQVEMINTLINGINYLITAIPGAFKRMVDGGDGSIPPWKVGTEQPGTGGTGEGIDYERAAGGPTMPGRLTLVGESGMEIIKSSVPQHVFPNNETFAAMLGGTNNLNDPWAQTVIGTAGGTSTGESRTPMTVVINIGNERLGEFVLNTVNDALEVK